MAAGAASALGAPHRGNHPCWVYDDPATLRARAVDFLVDGAAQGYKLVYLGSSNLDEVHRDLAATPAYAALEAAGGLVLQSLEAVYAAGTVVDPPAPVRTYAEATDQALAEGYRGLRVAAEATALVRTAEQREAFARYEHLIDRYMVDHPFSALCAYDTRVLGAGVAEIACLHPAVSADVTPFQWYAEADADVALSGEIDIACTEVFDVTLARTLPLQDTSLLHVDARELAFIDHRGLLTLERRAQERGLPVELRTDSHLVHRLAQLLDLRSVQPRWSS